MKNKSNHIDIVVKYFHPVTAGIEVNISETYSKMLEKGYTITVHTSSDTHTEKNTLKKNDQYKGIQIRRYKYGFFGYKPDIDWNSTDYVCLHNFNVFPHCLLMTKVIFDRLLKRKKYSLFLTPHGGFNPEWSIFPPIIRYIKYLYHFTLGVLLINLSCDGVRAVSVWEGEEMRNKLIRKKLIEVIPNGVEDEAYMDVDRLASEEIKSLVNDSGEYIIQIGRVYVIKNYETAIRALSLSKNPNLKYLIVGGIEKNYHDDYKSKLDNLISELGLENRVIFTGIVRGVDKYYLIKHAKMMVHMALWESFCNVVHEGLSQGLICLVANNTALPYLIKDGVNGYCIDTLSYTKLAERIDKVLENYDSNELRTMREVNREYGLENSWKNVSDKVISFYSRTHETPN